MPVEAVLSSAAASIATYIGVRLKWKKQADHHAELLIEQMRKQLEYNSKRVEVLEQQLTEMQTRVLDATKEVQDLKISQIADRAQIRLLKQELDSYQRAS